MLSPSILALRLPFMHPEPDAASARAAIQPLRDRLRAARVDGFRDPPPQPTTCCGRGCNGCVWEGYFAAVGWWCEDARGLLSDGCWTGPSR